MFLYDVVIAGRGLVGLTLALHLRKLGLKVALIDPAPLSDIPKTRRALALNRVSQAYLASLDAWPSKLAAPYEQMRVWMSGSKAELSLASEDICSDNLGHFVLEPELFIALQPAIESLNLADDYYQASVENLQRLSTAGYKINLSNGVSINTKLLIAADGAHSKMRELLGIKLQEKSYAQQAIVTTITTEKSHGKTARQVFLATGPLGCLPLSNPHELGIVWSCDTDYSRELLALADIDFRVALAKAMDNCLGEVKSATMRQSFPLVQRHTDKLFKDQAVLMGDAAHTFHPLAGLGLNVSLHDANALLSSIKRAIAENRAINHVHTLGDYARQCVSYHTHMRFITDKINYMFSRPKGPLTAIAKLGFKFSNQSNRLKRSIIRYALAG